MLFLSGLPSGYIQTALGTTVAGIQVIQQNGTCTGIVTDQNGETVIGASVVVKGTTNGTISGLDGDFSIPSVKKGDVIIITYVGYVSQEIVWDGKPMKVILKEDSKTLDEVVVVGYGTTSKRKTTSAVSQVKADDIAKVPVPNITQSLAGRAPGLIVTQSGGGVNAKASISIRGGGTPLYVIDNIICEERDFQNLNPEDIDQMSILKDASATAVYGARAANGIVMVTTKTGKTGKLNVDYSFNYTLSQPADLQDKVDCTVEVALDRPVPQALELDHDCVENMSCTPEVEIRNCHFTRTSTRGTLMTTPRKVVIAGNTYYKTGMSAILIEGDAEGWYESGPVKDVLIENNTFIDCAYNGGPENAVIALHPSNTVVDANRPVHRNVRIIGNRFQLAGNPVLYAKSTEGLVFKDNEVELLPDTNAKQKELFILNGCKKVEIKDNVLPHAFSIKDIRFENMKKKYRK